VGEVEIVLSPQEIAHGSGQSSLQAPVQVDRSVPAGAQSRRRVPCGS
jgi:hypothetical protein